ncbi:Wzz/FepE/Etk N-terminal domain-containing protein [Polymorphobacter fuscus]|uniref:Exopolysaccharide biosynthesis protein EpsF n=1 Tax=Sandarakinorhabdus fusca TaxID=1439888 RepID=A0A7C9GNW0_9SPHN|nr:Wzz/FepE/Etk N-terminal domain-containing protein [Polymorphobacter fuscus]KAB7648926.1 exopolysaccharide biosynthesis protein EpsF [Polymorphobacter fuscus]MQT16516.1 exopolysaccharide biosynthesis protein EpsF [Polymorphobacter fuscus]NJC07194.1 uncharacterized protein involved in exopolysaccharide biosynthesis [Polymorphobacter fuscus]
MSIMQFLRILMVRRWIIIISLVTCVVVAVATAKSLPERYDARARVILDVVKPDPVTGQMLGGPAVRSYIKTQTELIQDYRVAGDVVDRAGWLQNPAVIAAWQADTGGVGDMRRWAAQRIINATNAGMVDTSNILEITYEGPNPEVAKTIVSMLRDAYIDASLRFRTDSAGRTADWYREQSDRAQRALVAAEDAMNKFEKDNGIVMGPQNAEAESSKLASLQGALMAARASATDRDFEATRAATTAPVVDQLKVQLATLNDQIGQAGERLGTEHPTYKALLSRRQMLNSEISRETAAARAAGAMQSGSSASSIARLNAEYEAQKALVLGMKGKLNELGQLQREVELRRDQYQKAAARTADLRLQANLSESGLVVLGDAMANGAPSFPKWPMILGMSAGFGLALGIVIAMITELMARRVRGVEDLAFATRAPVLAIVAEGNRTSWLDRIRNRFSSGRKATAEWQPAQ